MFKTVIMIKETNGKLACLKSTGGKKLGVLVTTSLTCASGAM